jgi:hypothetical protein
MWQESDDALPAIGSVDGRAQGFGFYDLKYTDNSTEN